MVIITKNMHYLRNHDIYFSTTYHMPVYDITYKNLGHTHYEIDTTAEKDEYNPPKKSIQLEMLERDF